LAHRLAVYEYIDGFHGVGLTLVVAWNAPEPAKNGSEGLPQVVESIGSHGVCDDCCIHVCNPSEASQTGCGCDPRDEQPHFIEWAAAWLHEYRCYCRYVALLDTDGGDDRRLSIAWLEWWNASMACREAECRLENSPSG